MESPAPAEKWVNKVFDEVFKLKKYPESGRIVNELEINEICEQIYGNYRIIYKIMKKSIIIYIISALALKIFIVTYYLYYIQ